MKKKHTFFSILLLSIVSLTACHKKSQADFRLDKFEYKSGEMLEIRNFSKSDIWTIVSPDETVLDTLYGKHPQYVIPLFVENGTYTINAFDNEKELEAGIGQTKTFLVKYRTGVIITEGIGSFETDYDIYLDGYFAGYAWEGVCYIHAPEGKLILKAVAPDGSIFMETITNSYNIINDISIYG